MKRTFTVAVLVATMTMAMAVASSASGIVTLTLNPSPAVAGNDVAVSLSSTTTDGNWLQVFVCYATDEDGNAVATLPLPYQDCDAGLPDTKWELLGQAAPADGPLTDTFATTGLAGRTVGFLGQHTPPRGIEAAKTFQNLEVAAPAVVTERHAGCNGIENAITKVKAASNAKGKLDDLARKFDCDL